MTEGPAVKIEINATGCKSAEQVARVAREVLAASQEEFIRLADLARADVLKLQPYQEAFIRKLLLNSTYGKFASGGYIAPGKPIPIIFDHSEAVLQPTSSIGRHLQMQGRALRWPSPFASKPLIPALEVPEAPSEPEAVVEPESASVQMLRTLLADRHRELERYEGFKRGNLEEIEDLKRQLASEEAELAQHERHIAAAQVSIDQVLADIKALGGRDEPAQEA